MVSTSIELIDKKLAASDSNDWRRAHLGGSGIGDECLRKIWYSFRWFKKPDFEGRILRLFRRGHKEEPLFIEDLELIGVKVSTGPEPGKQWSFQRLGGHFGGSIDGAAIGLPETRNEWTLLEFKTHNEKSFKDLEKRGLKVSKPMHFDQIQIYGHALGFSKALYLAVCKNDDRRYSEIVEIDEGYGDEIIRKAEHIITAKEPPQKLSKSPSFYYCKWCPYLEICHYDEKPASNCRTCVFSKPSGVNTEKSSEEQGAGVWSCGSTGQELSFDEQKKGCNQHSAIF
tara:strand:- start:2039 stop:2890 length:852 start_codon:yes stop_codon:yes gene_type:complete